MKKIKYSTPEFRTVNMESGDVITASNPQTLTVASFEEFDSLDFGQIK